MHMAALSNLQNNWQLVWLIKDTKYSFIIPVCIPIKKINGRECISFIVKIGKISWKPPVNLFMTSTASSIHAKEILIYFFNWVIQAIQFGIGGGQKDLSIL